MAMSMIQQSLIRKVANNAALQFTSDGTVGALLDTDVPPTQFEGQTMFSLWYKIANTDPATGDRYLALIESGINFLRLGITYAGTDEASFFVELNTSRFQTGTIFDADTTDTWKWICGYVDFQTPANSICFVNDIEEPYTTVPASNSTQFVPINSTAALDDIVSGTCWAYIWLAKPTPPISTAADFAALKNRLLLNDKPCTTGVHGYNFDWKRNAWLWLPFDQTDPLVNAVNGATLDITGVSFQVNTNDNIAIDASPSVRTR